ncbi:MAG: helix-turn-helix transcriptional regulator [Lachnospiraceae bacterium]|nr:helix-turn-helix transcriptional regulator [Lachnospiraceae bacterium]
MQPGDFMLFPPKTIHTIDYLPAEDKQLHGFLPERSADSCPQVARPQEPIPNQTHDAILPVSKLHTENLFATPKRKIVYHVLKFDLGFLQATGNMKNQFSRIISLAYEKNPANTMFFGDTLKEIEPEILFSECVLEMQQRRFGYDTVVCAKLATLITAMTRHWMTQGMNLDEILLSSKRGNYEFEHITEYIETHYKEPLLVQDLAQRCKMSYSYFAKLFRENYYQSCKEYIEFVRINKVTDLLLFTKLDLNYISQETGFADCSHLIRTFRKWKGCTPRQWMREYSSRAKQETT